MLRRRFAPLLFCCLLAGLVACDTDDGRELPEPGPDQTASIATTTTVAAGVAAEEAAEPEEPTVPFTMSAPWVEAQPIPAVYTCEGEDRVPGVSWSGVPEGTIDIAVVMTDLDAEGFVHWVAFGLDPAGAGIAEGAVPEGTAQAKNDFGTVGYGGPCPPSGTHTYLLEVYALSQQIEVPDGAAAPEALLAIDAASLAVASVSGTFTAS